jgi:hypothetical protein
VPVVLREAGVRVVIYVNDHRPAHVHCFAGSGGAVVELEPQVTLRAAYGLSAQEQRRILDLVEARRGQLSRAWRRLHP